MKYGCLALLCAVLFSCTTTPGNKTTNEGINNRVDSLLSLMTLEEKIGQLTQFTSDYDVTGPTIRPGYKEDIRKGRVGSVFNAFGAAYTRQLQEIAVKETRLGIPLLFGYDVIHGHRTIFPIPLGEAASWDLEAIRTSAEIAAAEASAEGLHWTFAPMCDISRDPRWGRVLEGAGEDTYLGSRIAEARVRGFQGNQIGDPHHVLACVKHFAAYGAPQAGRDYHTVDMSERVLREVYLPPYKAAIDAGAATVMSSFNEFDGVPATGNKYLLTNILRDEWGFNGFVVSDYTSIMEMIPHGIVADTASAAALALEAGLDMDMQAGFYNAALKSQVESGKIPESLVDAAVRRILYKKFEMGLFDDPYKFSNEQREKETVMKPAFLESARDVSRKSIVLLKNNGLLPLAKDVKTIAVIGPLAEGRRELIGSWSGAGDWKKAVTLLEGIKAAVSPGTKVLYTKGANINDDTTAYIAKAVALAKQADVVVLAIGESSAMSGEAASRATLGLPGVQQQLADAVKATGKPVAVVLMNGRPLTIPELDSRMDAILETWFLGTQAGNAIADVLFGDYNPTGKLPMTFPRSVGQIPLFYSAKNTGRPRDLNNKYTSKYLDESNDPLYPFGFGLSYTSFEYSNLTLDKAIISSGDSIKVTVTIANTGKRKGSEIVQLYLRDLVGSVTRPLKELKGFSKVTLEPGESKQVTFVVSTRDLEFLRQDMTVGTEPGKFEVYVGGNSRDVLQQSFELK